MDGSFNRPGPERLRIAVVGSGIAGLSAAWLLRGSHDVTLYEKEGRVGGHCNTVEAADRKGAIAVDTGFIVFNEANYPNLTALFDHLDIATKPSDMSFSVSTGRGAFEYAGSLGGMLAQPRNILSPRFWAMLGDIRRFYRDAPGILNRPEYHELSLGAYLERERYSDAFVDDHILPMAAAIWSTPVAEMRNYPVATFVRFYENHGLLKLVGRSGWRTVVGGSRTYIQAMSNALPRGVRTSCGVRAIRRSAEGVVVTDDRGGTREFDHVVIAAHADEAIAILADASADEHRLLGAFRYVANEAVLHGDETLMPKRRGTWSSWNYIRENSDPDAPVCVTYWMNRLQNLATERPLFVTLNAVRAPKPETVIDTFVYQHPMFDGAALAAQRELWSLQGVRNTWFCGSYFGAGFHEDALQSGLAAAEALGGVRRPWTVANESGRIVITDPTRHVKETAA